ncbi:MAG: protease SohB [Gammaproteobacteria bacterium]|nr:protease SohB [Gammaproteobacteria bacterium]
MNDFFLHYGLFLAEAITIVLAIGAIIVLVVRMRGQSSEQEKLEVKKLNARYEDMALALKSELLPDNEFKKVLKEAKKHRKETAKHGSSAKKRLFVLNFDGDIKASAVSNLREEVTAVLMVARSDDEVFLRLNSSGGMVHAYGLAASQLARFRTRNIPLTIAVDKVAASGGYMMACVANRILAAPFSILGSIGVIAQLPNFSRVLKKNDIDYEQFTAGEFKRTVTMFGENTDAARAKFREEIEETHRLFKNFVHEFRPSLDIAKVSTGEHWYGTQALDLKLVDQLQTSDDYLLEQSQTADVFEIIYTLRKPWSARLSSLVHDVAGTLRSKVTHNATPDHLI